VTSTTTLAEPQYVTFFAGGNKGKRPILGGINMKPTFDTIPIVNFSNISSDSLERRKELALEVRRAFIEVGFLYASNHGISETLQAEVLRVMKEFFALPTEEKMKIHINNSLHMQGYEALLDSKLDANTRGGKSHSAVSFFKSLLTRGCRSQGSVQLNCRSI
jgi:isopenicillin N synthase-like dioxygenase